MSEKNIKAFKVFLGLYLIGGGIISLFFVFSWMGVLGFLSYLIPATITVSVILFFILSGYKYAFSVTNSGTLMMKISLFIQAFQLVLMGLSFKNYYGPYLAVGFTDTPDLKFHVLFEPLTCFFSNGVNKISDEISVGCNLVAVGLLILVYKIESSEIKSIADRKNIDIGV